MTGPTLPLGTAMALAERTLGKPLAVILDRHGVDHGTWFTLNALALRGPLPAAVVKDLLGTNGYGDAAAEALINAVQDAGELRRDVNELSLTDAGRRHQAAIRDRIALVTQRMLDRFDAERVETTRALLQELAELDEDELVQIANDAR